MVFTSSSFRILDKIRTALRIEEHESPTKIEAMAKIVYPFTNDRSPLMVYEREHMGLLTRTITSGDGAGASITFNVPAGKVWEVFHLSAQNDSGVAAVFDNVSVDLQSIRPSDNWTQSVANAANEDLVAFNTSVTTSRTNPISLGLRSLRVRSSITVAATAALAATVDVIVIYYERDTDNVFEEPRTVVE